METIWTRFQCCRAQCYIGLNMTMRHEFIALQWRHMSVTVSQDMGNSTVSTGCWGTKKIKAQYYWPFVRGIHGWLDWCVAKPQPVALTENFDFTRKSIWSEIWWCFTVAFNNTNIVKRHEYITLQWRHMSAIVSQITSSLIGVSTACWG